MRFAFSTDFVINSDVQPYRREGLRVAMLGGPGSGKSWNNSLLAEQFLSQGGTIIVFQPRDEYYTLKEKFDVLSVGGVHAKDIEFALTSPSIYAKAVVEDGVSMIFYTSGLDEDKLVDWVSKFINYILNYQEKVKRPLLLILEEAHEYAPMKASGHIAPPWVYNRMIKAFKDCFTQGRKLNLAAVASSQRPQELNFTIRQLANISFYGKFGEQDIGYVDRNCLKYIRDQGIEVDASRLVSLELGEWLVIMGKDTKFVTVTQPRLTKHGAETPRLEYVAPRTRKAKKTISVLTEAVMTALKKEETEKSEIDKLKRKIRNLEDEISSKDEKIKELNTALTVAGKLQVETRVEGASKDELLQVQSKLDQYSRAFNSIYSILCNLDPTFQSPIRAVTPPKNDVAGKDVFETWASKLPTCPRNILRFLINNQGLKLTRSEIAMRTGYSSKGGTFSSGLSLLKRHSLIKHDGQYYWYDV